MAAIKERSGIQIDDRWDLSPLFNSDESWEELFREVESSISGYDKFRGHLHESLDMFRGAIFFDLDISRKLERLYTFAHLKNDEDKTNQKYLGVYQRAISLYTRTSEASSYLTPEIQSIPDNVLSAYRHDESLKEYSFYLDRIIRYKPHTLSREIEEVLAITSEVAHAPSQIFSQLDNADLRFGSMKNTRGEEVELSHGNFSTFLQTPDRSIREKAFFQYYKAYDDHKNTIAAALDASIKKNASYARVRRFQSARSSSLFSDDVPASVYDNLVSTVRNNTAPLFRYLNFRKEALGLTELHFYDTYVPLVDSVDFTMSYNEAVDTCIESLRPLGEEYVNTLRKGLLGGWVDRYENRGKRSGAYSSGCYDSPPYILMNYEERNINSLYTLIHEAGHSMHSLLSKTNQPYHQADYTIFVAEVASTFNETLLSHYLLDKYRNNPSMRAYILNREIDNIRANLYRQTMFAEFEKITHEMAERHEPLTLDAFREVYTGLLKGYFGDTLVIDDVLALECLRIPHFYSAFYVYKYATGISAAIALADSVLSEGGPAKERYLKFLTLGGSMFPIEELKTAGVDMGTPVPVEKAIGHFSGLVDRFIDEFKAMKK